MIAGGCGRSSSSVDPAEFGRYLAQQRELRGMTREDVAARTKIPSSLLLALENGEAERLPGRVFVANYVRAYAEVIGLAPEETVAVRRRARAVHAGAGPAGGAARDDAPAGRGGRGAFVSCAA